MSEPGRRGQREPRPGERWAHLRIHEAIARGNMGAVYRATDDRTGREVALKILSAAAPDRRAEAHARFAREARSLARLAHPNIVAVHSYGVHDGTPFLTMDLVAGGTLQELLDGGTLPLARAVDLLAQVARAMDHAHSRGVLHRDLKPANVLIDPDGAPQVTDFGLAKLQDASGSLTGEGDLVGTPLYMSPEQIRGDLRAIGPAADVWALGVALYLALCRKLPFPGRTVEAVADAVVHLEPNPPSELADGVPEALERVCLTALHKDPTLRYRTAGELASDLEAYLRGGAVLAGRVTLTVRARRAARFLRLHATTAAAVAGGVVVAVTLAQAARLITSAAAEDAAQAYVVEATARRSEAAERLAAAQAALEEGRVADAADLSREVFEAVRRSAALTARAAAGQGPPAPDAAPPTDAEVARGEARDPSLGVIRAEALAVRGRALALGAQVAAGEDAASDLLAAARETGDPRPLHTLIDFAVERRDRGLAAQAETLLGAADEAPSPDRLRARTSLAYLDGRRDAAEVWRPYLTRDDALGRAARTLEARWRLEAGRPRAALTTLPERASTTWERLIHAEVLLANHRFGRLARVLAEAAPSDAGRASCLGARACLEQGRPRAAADRLASVGDGPLPAEVAGEVALLRGWVAATSPGETVDARAVLGAAQDGVAFWRAARLVHLVDPNAPLPRPPRGAGAPGAAAARAGHARAQAARAAALAVGDLALAALGLPPDARRDEGEPVAPLLAAASDGDGDALATAAVLLAARGERTRAEALLATAAPDLGESPALAAALALASGRPLRPAPTAPPPPPRATPWGLLQGQLAVADLAGRLARGRPRDEARNAASGLLTLAVRQDPFHAGARLARARLALLTAGDPGVSAAVAQRRRAGALRDAAAACALDPGSPEGWSLLLQALWVRDREQFGERASAVLEGWDAADARAPEGDERAALTRLARQASEGDAEEEGEAEEEVGGPTSSAASRLIRWLARAAAPEDRGAEGAPPDPEPEVGPLLRRRAARSDRRTLEGALDLAAHVLEEPRGVGDALAAGLQPLAPSIRVALDREVAREGARTGAALALRVLDAIVSLPPDADAAARARFVDRASADLLTLAHRRVAPGLVALRAAVAVWGGLAPARGDLADLVAWPWDGPLCWLLQDLATGDPPRPEARALLAVVPAGRLAGR